jgi:predicted nicotinamide N-methyase
MHSGAKCWIGEETEAGMTMTPQLDDDECGISCCEFAALGEGPGSRLFLRELPMEVGLGAELWDASKAMAVWMATHKDPDLFKGKRVAEIGAGVGLPGLMAARLGAAVVTLTDFSQPLVDNMAASVAANQQSWGAGQQVTAKALDWNIFLDQHIGTAERDAYDEAYCGEYDYVLLADGVYNPSHGCAED